MKPEVTPKRPPKTPPPEELVPEKPSLFSAEWFQNNRKFLIGTGVSLAVVLVAVGGFALRGYLLTRANAKAWESYSTLHTGLAFKPNLQVETQKKPQELIDRIEAALPQLKGSTAEPWALFDLGNAYFAKGDAPKAREVFLDLRARFGHHALTDSNASYRGAADVDAAIADCDAELEWGKTHQKPAPKATSSATSAPGASQGEGAPPGAGSIDAPAAPSQTAGQKSEPKEKKQP